MLKKLKDQNKGFTIIEVLIVLAIAGLIMLIVFMAVPALNRNKRNTQARSEVSNYLGAVQEWSNNNNGKVPANGPPNDLTTTNGVNSLANGTFMAEPATVVTGARTNVANPVGLQVMELVTGARCSATVVGETTAAPGVRAIAIRFSVEGSNGGTIPQCQES